MMRRCPGCGYWPFHTDVCPVAVSRWTTERPWWLPLAVSVTAVGLLMFLGSAAVLTFALLRRS